MKEHVFLLKLRTFQNLAKFIVKQARLFSLKVMEESRVFPVTSILFKMKLALWDTIYVCFQSLVNSQVAEIFFSRYCCLEAFLAQEECKFRMQTAHQFQSRFSQIGSSHDSILMQATLVSWGMEDRKCKVKIGDKRLSDNSGLFIFFLKVSKANKKRSKGRWKQALRHEESGRSSLTGIQSWQKIGAAFSFGPLSQALLTEFLHLPHSDAQVCQDQPITGLWMFACGQCELCTSARLCAEGRDRTQGRKPSWGWAWGTFPQIIAIPTLNELRTSREKVFVGAPLPQNPWVLNYEFTFLI